MKNSNKILVVFAAVMLLIATFVFSALADSATPILGDVNGNGEVKTNDARLALRAAVNIDKLTDLQEKCADVNFDLAVKASDARRILRHAVSIENLPVAPEGWFDDFINTTDDTTTTKAPTTKETTTKATTTKAPTTGDGLLATEEGDGSGDATVDAGDLFD